MRSPTFFWTAVAGLMPLGCYLVTASSASYWLDGGELAAAAITLDIAHPPGHPLSSLFGKLFCFVPFGPLPLRVVLGQSVAAALAIAMLFRSLFTVGVGCSLPGSIVTPLALAGCWLVGLCYGLWFQAVRPEVYALQALLLACALERLTQLVASGYRDTRFLYAAVLCVGLGLTNHHLMSFFFFVPLGYAALRVAAQTKSVRSFWISALMGLGALSVYAYLPLRAAGDLQANLGTPTTLERIYWVVSARVYARQMGTENPQPLHERFVDVLVFVVEQLGPLSVVLALVGGYALVRKRETREQGVLWLLVAASVLLVRPWIGPVRGNPDSMGYLLAGMFALAGLVLAGMSAGLSLWRSALEGGRAPRVLAWALAMAVLVTQVRVQGAEASLSGFFATDAFDDLRVRELPARAVVVATTPQTVFRYFETAAAERVRPDLTLVPLPFLRYPGVAERLLERTPALRSLLARYLEHDRLDLPAMRVLSRSRPVLVELDTTHVTPGMYPSLAPAGMLYAVLAPKLALRGLAQLSAARDARYETLERDLGAWVHEIETERQLLWLLYTDALHAAALGRREGARRSLAAAVALHPEDLHLQALATALADASESGPLNVGPYLRVDRPPAHHAR